MRTQSVTIIVLLFATLSSCDNSSRTGNVKIYAKEPIDNSDYKHLKYGFYLSKSGQLCERKLAMARDTVCNCEFEVYYDSIFSTYIGNTTIQKPLDSIIDIDTFVWVDSTDFSKDKNRVYYFYGNSDGGNRVIVDKADPSTFKRLCEYRWSIDKNYVFYQTNILEGLDLKTLQVLFPDETEDQFIQYVKDDKNVFFENKVVKGADAKTFKVVSGQKWEAEDRNNKYRDGRRQD